jgi:hypothetical protein
MKYSYLLPIAVLVFAAACSDTATSPTSPGGPLFLTAGSYPVGGVSTLVAAGTPSGGHIQSGAPIFCVVEANQSITCGSTSTNNGSYSINGIGHTNATALLSFNYSGTVTCTNKGGNLVEVKTQFPSTSSSGTLTPSKNGSILVPELSSSRPSDNQFEQQAVCPNGNWTKNLDDASVTLVSFTYTLVFDGFSTAAITISSS